MYDYTSTGGCECHLKLRAPPPLILLFSFSSNHSPPRQVHVVWRVVCPGSDVVRVPRKSVVLRAALGRPHDLELRQLTDDVHCINQRCVLPLPLQGEQLVLFVDKADNVLVDKAAT